jgi:DNA-directed RNA polymerase subunit H
LPQQVAEWRTQNKLLIFNGDASENQPIYTQGMEMSTTFNVLQHVMVPDHEIMSEEEVSNLLSTYQITHEQLPKIYHDDPSVKTIDAKIGNVVRIVRVSQTAGRAESYRLVVKRPKK